MNNKIHLIVINYNYNRFLVENKEQILNAKKYCEGFVIVDDQSTQPIDELMKIYGQDVIVTKHKKSKHNSHNQINAIYSGINYFKNIKSDDLVWIMDADDIPLMNKNIFSKTETSSIDFFMFSRKEEKKKITPYVKHPLWVKQTTTSSIIVRKHIFTNFKRFFKNKFFPTVWYDIRISMISQLKPEKRKIFENILCERVLHQNNDSKSYINSKLLIYSRIIKAMSMSLILKLFWTFKIS